LIGGIQWFSSAPHRAVILVTGTLWSYSYRTPQYLARINYDMFAHESGSAHGL